MIDTNLLTQLARKYDIDNFSVLREIFQVQFVDAMYADKMLRDTYFKGGTCLRLIYGSNRFSEDLDFTTTLTDEKLQIILSKSAKKLEAEYEGLEIKKLKTLQGASWKLYFKTGISPQPMTVKLDFSKRENVLDPQSNPIKTQMPVATSVVVNHLSVKEIFAEKVRACLNREKGRDVYDLWYILSKNDVFDLGFINAKLKYYGAKFNADELREKIRLWDDKKIYYDVAKFLSKKDRTILPHLKRVLLEELEAMPQSKKE